MNTLKWPLVIPANKPNNRRAVLAYPCLTCVIECSGRSGGRAGNDDQGELGVPVFRLLLRGGRDQLRRLLPVPERQADQDDVPREAALRPGDEPVR